MRSSLKSETYKSKTSTATLEGSFTKEDLFIIVLARQGVKHIYLNLSSDDAEALGKELIYLAKTMKENKRASE